MAWSIAVGGATGNVGTAIVRLLQEREFPVHDFTPLASKRSVQTGRHVSFRGRDYAVLDIDTYDLSSTDILFLSTGSENSKTIVPHAAEAGCTTIDNSSAFRMDPDVDLVVPEINGHLLAGTNLVLGHVFPVANCSTIQLAMVLHALRRLAPLSRIVVSTYQSASGGGRAMLDRLDNAVLSDVQQTQKPLAYNVIPHIDDFLDDGRTKEEWKMEVETRRILDLPNLPIAVTCARVPVRIGHAEAVAIEFEKPVGVDAARECLASFPGISLLDDPNTLSYATPLEIAGTDNVWVSRIREDPSVANGLLLWIVADNVRKGAALNAVQIAERLVRSTASEKRCLQLD